MGRHCLASLLVLLGLLACVDGLIHHLTIKNDPRRGFFIENFGFLPGGVQEMVVSDWQGPYPSGFVIKRSNVNNIAYVDDGDDYSKKSCLFKDMVDNNFQNEDTIAHRIPKDHPKHVPLRFRFTVGPHEAGLYHVFYVSCTATPQLTSFKLALKQWNIEFDGASSRNYLSVGQFALPSLYLLFALAFLAMTLGWGYWLVKQRRVLRANVQILHWLMLVLVGLKTVSAFLRSAELSRVAVAGHAEGWEVAYLVFAFLKGCMLFTLLALLGSGWLLLKPFLSLNEKRLLAIVISLQVLDNIALIAVEEMAPGSLGWFQWRDILRLVDIICCGAVLIPIIWSIRHLREASRTDGKASRSLNKITLFRQFYISLIAYVYFTRIVVEIMGAMLPYRHEWMAAFFEEVATFLFYAVVGYMFRPDVDNPYLRVDTQEESSREGMELEEAQRALAQATPLDDDEEMLTSGGKGE